MFHIVLLRYRIPLQNNHNTHRSEIYAVTRGETSADKCCPDYDWHEYFYIQKL